MTAVQQLSKNIERKLKNFHWAKYVKKNIKKIFTSFFPTLTQKFVNKDEDF